MKLRKRPGGAHLMRKYLWLRCDPKASTQFLMNTFMSDLSERREESLALTNDVALLLHQKLKGFVAAGQSRPIEKALWKVINSQISADRVVQLPHRLDSRVSSEVLWRSLQNAQHAWMTQPGYCHVSNCCHFQLLTKDSGGISSPVTTALFAHPELIFTQPPFFWVHVPSNEPLQTGGNCFPSEALRFCFMSILFSETIF